MTSIGEAVDMLYHGKCNVIEAANACGTTPDMLKQLLLEKVRSKPELEPLQLTLPLK
jgi:hypothetical protein